MAENELLQDSIRYVPSKVAAKRVGLSPDYISRFCRQGLVTATWHRGMWWVNEASLDKFVAEQARQREEYNRKLAAETRKETERARAATPTSEPHPNLRAYTRTIARDRARKVLAKTLATITLVVSLGSAFALTSDRETYAAFNERVASVGASLTRNIGSARDVAETQLAAAASSLSWLDALGQKIFQTLCPLFNDCPRPEFAAGNLAPRPMQPPLAAQPQRATTTSATSFQAIPIATPQPIPQTVINQPVIERVRETVSTVIESGINAAYVDQRLAAIQQSLQSQIAAAAASSHSESTTIYQTLGAVASSDNFDDINVTDSDITNSRITGGSISGASISGDITATDFSGVLAIAKGGTGTSTAPTYGKVLLGNSSGSYDLVATSSLGISGGSGASFGQTFELASGALSPTTTVGLIVSASSTFNGGASFDRSTTTNATSTNFFATLGRFTTAIADTLTATAATITNLTSTTITATNATTTRVDALDYVAVGRTATTTIRGDGVASTLPYASTTAISATTASSSNLIASNTFTFSNVTGFLKATAGAVATAAIDLANDVTGILTTPRGGTGWGAIQANTVVLGNGSGAVATTSAGTNGQVLALVSGVPSWVATTTLATISGTLSGTQLDGVFGSNGLLTRTTTGTYASRTLTGTSNQITVTNGDGVSGNPTLSFPTLLTFTQSSSTQQSILDGLFVGRTATTTIRGDGVASTIPFASTTAITVSGTASTSALIVSGLNAANCDVKASTAGVFSCGTDAGGSGTWPFTPGTFGATAVQATTTALQLQGGLFASSTVRFGNAGVSPFFYDGSVGRLGIGTTSPWALLSVDAPAGVNSFAIGSSTATHFLVNSSGHVGIGTTTPQWLLNPFSANAAQLSLSAGAGTAQWAFRNAGGDLYLATTTVAGTATTSISALEIAGSGFGTTTLRGLNISGQATSTSNVGYNITTGCYAISGTCIGGADVANYQEFTGDGTWTKPSNFDVDSLVYIETWGGGGSGGRAGNNDAGGGGGGGAYVQRIMKLSELGATETVDVGAGGASRTSDNQAGAAGSNTTFGSHVTAYGGGGGSGADTSGNGGGGGGGSTGAGTTASSDLGGNGGTPRSIINNNTVSVTSGLGGLDVLQSGSSNTAGGGGGGYGDDLNTSSGAGGDGVTGGGGGGGGALSGAASGGSSTFGGAGGGGGSLGTASGSGGTSLWGGAGGAGNFDSNNATAGTQPGGGGGGSESGNSGAGGDGKVVVRTIGGADIAENYPVSDRLVAEGDIVAFDASAPAFLKRATTGDSASPLAGVISTDPEIVLGAKGAAGQRPLALSGRVPVKFSDENGNVRIGDRITISSSPGVGMKASIFDPTVGIVIAPIEHGENGNTVMIFLDLQPGFDIAALTDKLLEDSAVRLFSASTTDAATTTTATSTATTTPPADTSFVGRLFASLTSRIVAWFADAANGIERVVARVFKGERVETQELCVDDVCVTRDQFAEVFGNQSAAAGAPINNEAPDGSSASGAGEMTDTATSTTPSVIEPITSGASSTPDLVELEAQLPSAPANDNDPAEDTLLVVDVPAAQLAPELLTPEPANDNPPPPTAEAI